MKEKHGQKDVILFADSPACKPSWDTVGYRWVVEPRSHHPPKKVIHLILDRASYHRAQSVVQAAERLWKVMNQQVRRKRYFPSSPEFRQAIQGFFDDI